MTEVLVNSITIDKHFKKRHVTQLYSEILQRYVTSLKIFISLFATHCNRERWRNRGRQRERFHLLIHSPHAQNAKQELTEDWNQELYCCLFHGWWIPGWLLHLMTLSQVVSRELHQKWNSQDSNCWDDVITGSGFSDITLALRLIFLHEHHVQTLRALMPVLPN